jgi:hypothetical protein
MMIGCLMMMVMMMVMVMVMMMMNGRRRRRSRRRICIPLRQLSVLTRIGSVEKRIAQRKRITDIAE